MVYLYGKVTAYYAGHFSYFGHVFAFGFVHTTHAGLSLICSHFMFINILFAACIT